MKEQILNYLNAVTWQSALIAVAIFLVTFVGSLAIVAVVVVKIPANYFHSSHEREFMTERHKLLRWTGFVAKNLLGVILIVLGVLMSLPGVPGQGLLTVLLGVMLVDFPGKRRLETKLVGRPKILQSINRLRAKYDKPPLVLD